MKYGFSIDRYVEGKGNVWVVTRPSSQYLNLSGEFEAVPYGGVIPAACFHKGCVQAVLALLTYVIKSK